MHQLFQNFIVLVDLPFYFQIQREAFYETLTIKITKHLCVKFHRRRTSMKRYEQGGGEQEQVICEVLEVVFMLLGTDNSKHWTSPRKIILKIIHFSLMGKVNLHKNNNFNFDFLYF